jgi:hypothetical protein
VLEAIEDWDCYELGQVVVWLVVRTLAFRKCLSDENERLARVRLHAPQPLT